MSQVNRATGVVRIRNLSCIREGRALTGRDDPVDKKLLEVSLEGGIESHLSNNREEEKKRQKFGNSTYKVRATNAK